jgi:hypothetical protein
MNRETIVAFVVGLIVGAVLHHFFMAKSMKAETAVVENNEVQKFGTYSCDTKCDTSSINWAEIKSTCARNNGKYKKCHTGSGWFKSEGRMCANLMCR